MKTELYKLNNKAIARKMFNDGQKIKLYANKVNPHNIWIDAFEIQKDEIANSVINQTFDAQGFDFIVDRFEVYNCNYETGYYTAFYVDVEVKR